MTIARRDQTRAYTPYLGVEGDVRGLLSVVGPVNSAQWRYCIVIHQSAQITVTYSLSPAYYTIGSMAVAVGLATPERTIITAALRC